jgi:hypothetical protein
MGTADDDLRAQNIAKEIPETKIIDYCMPVLNHGRNINY